MPPWSPNRLFYNIAPPSSPWPGITEPTTSWLAHDVAPGMHMEYGLYRPKTENDLHWLCRLAWMYHAFAVVSPEEITQERLAAIMDASCCQERPFASLLRHDPVEIAQVPWLCLLSLRPHFETITMLGARRPALLADVAIAGKGLRHFKTMPLKEALADEKAYWRRVHRVIDPSPEPMPLSTAALDDMEQWRELVQEISQNNEEKGGQNS